MLFLFGLIGISSAIAFKIGAIVNYSLSINIPYRDIYLTSIAHNKISSLLSYIFTSGIIFLYVVILTYLYKGNFLEKKFSQRFGNLKILPSKIYLVISIIINFLIFYKLTKAMAPSIPIIAASALTWCSIFVLPYLFFINEFVRSISIPMFRALKYMTFFILVSSVIIFLRFFFIYPGTGYIKVANDYFNIPEKTLLDGKFFSNDNAIKKYNIGDFYQKNHPITSKIISDKTLSDTYYFKDITALVCENISKDKCLYFRYYLNQKTNRSYDQYELRFIENNIYEWNTQLVAGHYFHHQNAFLGPLNAFHLNEAKNNIVFLYGYGNTYLLNKLMIKLDGFNFQTFTHIFFSFYPLYFIMLIFVTWIIFRDIFLTAFVILSSIGAFQLLGFETIRFAPGNDPIRHFLDLLILLFLFQYSREKGASFIYLIGTCILALLSVWMDKEFGLIIFISFTLAFITKQMISKPKVLDALIYATTILGLGFILKFLKTLGADPLSIYGFLGVSVAPTSTHIKFIILLTLLVLYALLGVNLKALLKEKSYFIISIFLLFYFQGMLVYFVWYTDPSHFLSACAIPLILFLTIQIKFITQAHINKNYIIIPFIFSLIFVYIPSAIMFEKGILAYENIFKTHKLYQWDFKRAKFLSTMDPEPFKNAVYLIKKYDAKPDIYLISQYDNFLPFLSAKYSAFQYDQLDLSIVTEREFNYVVHKISTKKPKYIFIDSNIMSNHIHDIIGYNDPLDSMIAPNHQTYDLSAGRMLVLSNLRAIFLKIRPSYFLYKHGTLIDVYKRK